MPSTPRSATASISRRWNRRTPPFVEIFLTLWTAALVVISLVLVFPTLLGERRLMQPSTLLDIALLGLSCAMLSLMLLVVAPPHIRPNSGGPLTALREIMSQRSSVSTRLLWMKSTESALIFVKPA